MKHNSNAVAGAFRDTITASFAAAGIKGSPLSWHPETPEFAVQTKVGEYKCHVSVTLGDPALNFCSLMGYFRDAKEAAKVVDCNPFTGKWNFDGNGYIPSVEEAKQLAHGIVTRILKLRP